jgi:hypothetical protein
MKRLKYRIIICAAILLLIPTVAFSMGVSPYLPLNMSPEIERQIERLLIIAGRPVMTRPIALATVLEALHDARKSDEGLCNRVERYLERYFPNAGLTQLRVELALDSGESKQVLPNQYGERVDSSWEVSGGAYLRLGDYISFNLGGIAYQDRTNPTGTMLSLGIDYAQLDIGYRPHWLSPFTDSSMLVSTEAPTMPSVTLSNYRPISVLGLSYQVSLAEMSKSNHIVYQNGLTTGNPRLADIHLQMEPVTGFALSLNRQMQYGGGNRGQDSFGDFIHALFDPGKYDNIDSPGGFDKEFGNQQASVTSEMLFPGKRPFAVYFEYAGEDTSRYKNTLLGCVAFSMGIDFPSLLDRFDLTYEVSEWQNGWYVHHLFLDGLTNDGLVIGNWFGDQRKFKDDVAGLSQMVRLGWQAGDGAYMQAIFRMLKNDSYSPVAYKKSQEFGLSYSRPWLGEIAGAELYSGRDVFGKWYARLAANLSLNSEWMKTGAFDVSASDNPGDSTDLFIDMGVTYGRYRADRGKTLSGDSLDLTAKVQTPHLGLGVRRAVSEHNDLGVRIEWDRVAGHDLLSARMLDYRFRMGKHLAVGSFAGVGRYEFGTPAYGWYYGVGAQWLDLLTKWDLSIDARRHDELGRHRLLASDPSGNQNQDYFNVNSISVYLSRHF